MPFRSKFHVHTDARKFPSVYKFRYIRTRVNLHTDINLFSPVYKFCCIRTQVFLRLFRPAFRLRPGRYIYKKRAFSFQKMLLLKKIIPKKRRLPTLPQYSSTIGVTRLNFSVRNGKRWIPRAITTLISFKKKLP